METATIIVEGDCQTVRLPKSVLAVNRFVRQDGDAVVRTSEAKNLTGRFFQFHPRHRPSIRAARARSTAACVTNI